MLIGKAGHRADWFAAQVYYIGHNISIYLYGSIQYDLAICSSTEELFFIEIIQMLDRKGRRHRGSFR